MAGKTHPEKVTPKPRKATLKPRRIAPKLRKAAPNVDDDQKPRPLEELMPKPRPLCPKCGKISCVCSVESQIVASCREYVRSALSTHESANTLLLTVALALQEMKDDYGDAMVLKYKLDKRFGLDIADWAKAPLDTFIDHCLEQSEKSPPMIKFDLCARLCRECGDEEIALRYDGAPDETVRIESDTMKLIVERIRRRNAQ